MRVGAGMRLLLGAVLVLATLQVAWAEGEKVEAVVDDAAQAGLKYGSTTQQLLASGRFGDLKIEDFYVEIVSILSLVVFGLNYWRGQSENVKLATRWIQANKELLLKNFSLVGDGDGLLIKGGPNKFVLWSSGRINCKYMLGVWQMKRRHDLASSLYNLVMPDYDTLTIEVQPDDDSMAPYVFCLARAKQEKSLRDTFKDLQDYGSRMGAASLGVPEGFVVLADSAEAAEKVMGSGLGDLLQRYGDYIEFVHLSDQYQEPMQDDKKDENDRSLPEPEKRLRFCFKVPRNGNIGAMQELTDYVINSIDSAKMVSLSANAKAKAEKLRAKAAKERLRTVQQQKQEEEQRRKDEEKAEKKKAAEAAGGDALRKLEEKEKRKGQKKMANRMKARVAM